MAGTDTDDSACALAHDPDRRDRADHHRPQRQSRRGLRPVDQSLPRLRARLHLLLRPPGPRLYGPFARPRFREQTVLQAGRRAAARNGARRTRATRRACIHIGGNTDPYQPQERRLRVTRRRDRGAVALPPSTVDHHQVGPDRSRRRPARPDGPSEPARRAAVSVTTLDRQLARVMEPRAATPERRLGAIRALTDAGRPDSGDVRPGDPRPQRPRDGGGAGARRRGGRRRRGLRRPAPAAGDQGPLPRVAGGRTVPTAPPA